MSEILNDFRRFAISNGVNGGVFDDYAKHLNNSLTPVVLEERKLNATAVDIYSRMLYDRILFFGEEFNKETCNTTIAELLYLNSISDDDIKIYINSPGGSVIDGLSVIDTINLINCDVSTTCTGMAASMGAVLLSAGAKGKRFVLPHSRVMIHQVSSSYKGTFSDIEIEVEQTKRCRDDIYKILANNLGKTTDEITKLCDRNNWFIGQEAVDLGIADKLIGVK